MHVIDLVLGVKEDDALELLAVFEDLHIWVLLSQVQQQILDGTQLNLLLGLDDLLGGAAIY